MLSAQQLSILQELADGGDHPVNRHKHRALTNLLNDGYIEEVGDGIWCITIEGREAHAAAMAATAEPKPRGRRSHAPKPDPRPRFNIAPMPKPAEDFYDPQPPADVGTGLALSASPLVTPSQDASAVVPSKTLGASVSPLPASGEGQGVGFIMGLDHAFEVHIAQPDRSILQLEILRGIIHD